jgi:hypothetical protein
MCRIYPLLLHRKLTKKTVMWRVDRCAESIRFTGSTRENMSADMQAGSLWNDLLKNGSVIHTNTYRRYAKRIRDRHFKLPVPHFRMPASSSSRRVHPSLHPVSSPSNLRCRQGTHPRWYPFVRKTFKFTAVRVTGNSPARRT